MKKTDKQMQLHSGVTLEEFQHRADAGEADYQLVLANEYSHAYLPNAGLPFSPRKAFELYKSNIKSNPSQYYNSRNSNAYVGASLAVKGLVSLYEQLVIGSVKSLNNRFYDAAIGEDITANHAQKYQKLAGEIIDYLQETGLSKVHVNKDVVITIPAP